MARTRPEWADVAYGVVKKSLTPIIDSSWGTTSL